MKINDLRGIESAFVKAPTIAGTRVGQIGAVSRLHHLLPRGCFEAQQRLMAMEQALSTLNRASTATRAA